MQKDKILKTAVALTLGSTLLTACASQESKQEENTETGIVSELYQGVEIGDKQVFEPYEHLFYIRYRELEFLDDGTEIKGNIVIPDGYEVLQIEQYNEPSYSTSRTAGYDVWYTNNKTVEVEAVYNEAYGRNDFSTFGKVVEKDNTQEMGKTL